MEQEEVEVDRKIRDRRIQEVNKLKERLTLTLKMLWKKCDQVIQDENNEVELECFY